MNKNILIALDFGYEVNPVSEHYKYNHEVGQPILSVTHLPEGCDWENTVARVPDEESALKAIVEHSAKHEPELFKWYSDVARGE